MMKSSVSFDRGLLRMGGISSMLGGIFILTFAVVAQSKGILFYNEIFDSASVEPWVRNMQASPLLSKVLMVLPVLGFACMLVTASVLYQYIEEPSWQKNLALVGYGIGAPLVVATFIAHLSLIHEVLLLSGSSGVVDPQLAMVVSVRLYWFHVVNHFFGPFFVIVLGTTMMAWAALKGRALPKWICIWLMLCGLLLLLSFFGFLVPPLGVAGLGAPLHMLGLVALGVILLRRSVRE